MRCLGTLEFLCDFYDRCHHTQKELLAASRNQTEMKYRRESDTESDKENSYPPTIEAKRKSKATSEFSKNTKSCLAESKISYYKSERNEDLESRPLSSNNSTNVSLVQASPMASQIYNFPKRSPSIDNHLQETKPESDRSINSGNNKSLKCDSSTLENKGDSPDRKAASRTTRSAISKSQSSSTERNENENENDRIEAPVIHVRRKRGRKSKAEKARILMESRKRDAAREVDERITENVVHRPKRQYLRAINRNESRKGTENVVLPTFPDIVHRQILPKKQRSTMSPLSGTTLNIVDDESLRTPNPVANNEEVLEKDRAETSISARSKHVSVIVKQERLEPEERVAQVKKSNEFVWIPNEMLGSEADTPRAQKGSKTPSHTSPPPGDEAEEETNLDPSTMLAIDPLHRTEIKGCTIADEAEQNLEDQKRTTVIMSAQSNEITMSDVLEEDNGETSMNDNKRLSERSAVESDESMSLKELTQDDSLSGQKKKEGKFGKISELISEEQKEAIETYYKVDMSIVNSDEVQKNLTVVDRKNIRCNICGSLYLRMDKCQVHIWGHLQMKPYQCKACDFATVTVSNVRCHIRKSHLKIKPFACHLCEKRFVTSVLLQEHLNTHTGARPFKCKICNFASASRQVLSYHSTIHKPVKDISCKICGNMFYSRGRMRAHMVIHNKDKVFSCKLCSAYLSSAEALETHHKNIHMRDYICNVCGKRLKSRKALHNHQNVHAAAKYKCTLCPNVYKSSQILKEHLLKHEGIRKYKCNMCGKSFAQQSHLAAHMAVHSDIRFHCPGCDKAFNRHDNMKIHTKRCKQFLANPELKQLLTKRERIISTNTDETSRNTDASYDSVSRTANEKQDAETKTAIGKEKTDLNLCQLGLTISRIEGSCDKIWRCENENENEEDVERYKSTDVIVIEQIDRQQTPGHEVTTVRENVLGPESF
ncbi:hypothetical protein KM043_015113 [Ampulex compressa]|nr:hypothetical protein KM043_015113 [Ampulex compressa]